ncbi:MAG: peptidoglycan DD-metalloendopeptidase family protein [Eubacteriales bacterium]|nr:peptidoglycan DD-metalloendopeptidase family protein [Eubacteriales bacterium]
MELSDVSVRVSGRKKSPAPDGPGNRGAVVAAICLCLAALCLSVVDLAPVNAARSAVRAALGEPDGKEDYGNYGKKIFVDEVLPGITQVLSEGLYVKRDIFMPVQGTISRRFEKGDFESVEIAAPAGAAVYACRDGRVSRIAESGAGKCVTLTHADGETSVYDGLRIVTVEVGQTVEKTELLGSTETEALRFSYTDGTGRAIDPLSLIYK